MNCFSKKNPNCSFVLNEVHETNVSISGTTVSTGTVCHSFDPKYGQIDCESCEPNGDQILTSCLNAAMQSKTTLALHSKWAVA